MQKPLRLLQAVQLSALDMSMSMSISSGFVFQENEIPCPPVVSYIIPAFIRVPYLRSCQLITENRLM